MKNKGDKFKDNSEENLFLFYKNSYDFFYLKINKLFGFKNNSIL
jgi:hypothetical protein